MLLRHRFAHLDVRPLRGNLDTRLSKLDKNNYAAIILAAAGLKRLGLTSRIRTVLSPEDFLPAAGQGALAIEIATHRTDLLAWLKPLHHLPTALSISAERALARALGGSCQLPLAAYADWHEEIKHNPETLDSPSTSQISHQKTPQRLLRIRAVLGLPNGRKHLQAQAQDSVNTTSAAIALGEKLAQNLLAQGAEKILAAL
jgi:hydroxymethylbilane synthase